MSAPDEMTRSGTWDDYLDRVLSGQPASVETFAKSAIGELPPADRAVRYPTGGPSVWGESMWAEMQAIAKGQS